MLLFITYNKRFNYLDNETVRNTVYVLSYLNHSLNWVFYGMTCKTYRRVLFGLFKKDRTKVSRSRIDN